jgi:hypothetical protein
VIDSCGDTSILKLVSPDWWVMAIKKFKTNSVGVIGWTIAVSFLGYQ